MKGMENMRKSIRVVLFSLLLTVLAVAGLAGIEAEAKDYIGTGADDEVVNICDLQVGDTVQDIMVKNLGDRIVYYQTDPESSPEQMRNDGQTSFSNSNQLYLVAIIEDYEAEDGKTYPLYVFNTENKRAYRITVTQTEDCGECSAFVENGKAAPGETVTLSVITMKGYEFKGWEVIEGDVTIQNNNTFIMPEKNVEIKAIFERTDNTEYTVTVNAVGRGTATVSYDSEETRTPSNTMTAKVGESLCFAYESEKGYDFLGWEIVKGDISIVSGRYAIMPVGDVVINAVFSDGTQKHVDVNGLQVGDVLKAWDGISDGGLDEYGYYDGDFYVQLDDGSPHYCWRYDVVSGVNLESQKNMFMGVYGCYYRVDTYLAEVTTITPEESGSGEMYTLYKFKTCAGSGAGVVEKEPSKGTASGSVAVSSDVSTLKQAVLSSGDKLQIQEGKDIAIWLDVDDITETVSAQDKAKVMSVIPQGSKVGMYLDIELFKRVASE